MKLFRQVLLYTVVIIVSGSFLFPKNAAQAVEGFSACQGKESGKWVCIETSKKNETMMGELIWENCIDGYKEWKSCKEALGAPEEILYNLCYNTTDSVEALCITEDFGWWDLTKKAPSDGYKCDIIGWSPKAACEKKLTEYLAEAKKAVGSVCCIPPKDKKSEVACASITANFDNKKEVDAKCETELGGADNYAFRQKGACSTVSDCKSTSAKKKTGGGVGSSDGAGVKPTSKPVGGGNFIISNLLDPLGNFTVPSFIGTLIKSALSVVGTIALVLFIYAGIMWMTAAGNEERTRSAAKIMMWTVLGLVAIFASYILVTFVFSALK